MRNTLCTMLLLAAGLHPAAAFEDNQPVTFRIVDLGVLPGATMSVANAISSQGIIAGASGPGAFDRQHAVVWDEDGRITDIHPKGFAWSQALGINGHGLVVGQACCVKSALSFDRQSPFLWNPRTGTTEMANLDHGINSAAAINDAGQAVGYMMTLHTLSADGAVYWTPDGALHELGPFDLSSSANAVNNRGWMAGSVNLAFGTVHAFLWSPQGGAQDLGTLAGAGRFTYSEAFAINNRGDVVGASNPARVSISHAFLWSAAGGIEDLGTLGDAATTARGINQHREVVGYAVDQTGIRAFYWTAKGGMQELPGLGHGSTQAMAISDDGQIVGFSLAADGNRHAVLWTRSDDN